MLNILICFVVATILVAVILNKKEPDKSTKETALLEEYRQNESKDVKYPRNVNFCSEDQE